MKILYGATVACFALGATATSLSRRVSFGGLGGPGGQAEPEVEPTKAAIPTTSTTAATTAVSRGADAATASAKATSISLSSGGGVLGLGPTIGIPLNTATSHSIIGTPSPMSPPSYSPASLASTNSAPVSSTTLPTAVSTAVTTPTLTPLPSPTSSSSDSSQWKSIGVAVLSLAVVGSIVAGALTWDKWKRFLCCGTRRDPEEALVPDFGTRDWEVRLATSDSRYPSAAVLPSEARRMEEAAIAARKEEEARAASRYTNPFPPRPPLGTTAWEAFSPQDQYSPPDGGGHFPASVQPGEYMRYEPEKEKVRLPSANAAGVGAGRAF